MWPCMGNEDMTRQSNKDSSVRTENILHKTRRARKVLESTVFEEVPEAARF
jgi:hypothetical protein